MAHDPNDDDNPTISRRTGLDRRWIPSPDHQPERRSGRDRRTRPKRAFLEIIESSGREADPSLNTDLAFRPASDEKPR